MHSQVPRPRIPSKWRLLLSAAALAAIRTSLQLTLQLVEQVQSALVPPQLSLELPLQMVLPHPLLAAQLQSALLLAQKRTDSQEPHPAL